MNNLSIEERSALLHSHSQTFADAWFSELSEQPCTPKESLSMVIGAAVLCAVPVVAFICFALS